MAGASVTPLPPVLWMGNDWFVENRTSSHHAALRMSAYTRVLYFGCPGLRVPQPTSRDLRTAMTKSGRAVSGIARITDSLHVGTLVQVPFHRLSSVTRLNGAMGAWTITRALRRVGMARPAVWCTVPHALPIVERLNPALLVYYCIDHYSAMPGVDAVAVQRLDDALAQRADVIVAASVPVYERHRRTNPATRLIPHGVDVVHFARPAHPDAMPDELKNTSGPLVGFIGTIEARIDLALVDWLARQFPQVTFVMIGRIAVPARDLCSSPNVRFLGPRPYALLPRYGHHFDVAIIPYRETAAAYAANPLKLREYLAMGLPVVSVNTPEVDRYRHVVSVANNRHEFAEALKRALSTRPDEDARRMRVAAVEGGTWEARVAEMIDVMRNAQAVTPEGTAS